VWDGEGRRNRVIVGLLVLLALASLTAAACSPDKDDDSTGGDGEKATATTQAPGTRTARVAGHVVALLGRYDDAVGKLTSDPAAAKDLQGDVAMAYRDLFEPGSADVDRALGQWAKDADSGTRLEPIDDGTPINESKLDGDITTVSADAVTFPVCDIHNYRQLDAAGKVLTEVKDQLAPGTGTAVRVDGVWYLDKLETADNAVGCATEGGKP
jgi:hypothetical protein